MKSHLFSATTAFVRVAFVVCITFAASLAPKTFGQTEQQVWIQDWAWQELIPESVKKVWVQESSYPVWIPPVTENVWVPPGIQEVWVHPVTHTETVPDQTHEEFHPAVTQQVFYPAEGYYVHRDAEVIEIYFPRITHFEQHPPETHTEYVPGYWSSYWVDEYGWVCDMLCEWVYDEYTEGGWWECWDDNCREEWIGGYEEYYWVDGYEYEVVDTEGWEQEVVDQEEHIEYEVIREAGEDFIETRAARFETEEVSPAWTEVVVDTWKVITVIDVEGHYSTQQVPGYWTTNEIPGCWDTVVIAGYYENQVVPVHWEGRVTPGHWSTVRLPNPQGSAPGAWDYESIARDAESYFRSDPVRFMGMMPDWGWDRIFNETGWSELEVFDLASLASVRSVRVDDALPFPKPRRTAEQLIPDGLRTIVGFNVQIAIKAVLGTVAFDSSFDKIYGWDWEEIPGYPVGRVWDGVTIANDFPQWNWQNWPGEWFMTSSEDDDPALVALFGEGPASRVAWEEAQRLRMIHTVQKARKLARLSRASILGLTLAMLLDIWLQQEIERLERNGPWSYVVYEKLQAVTGRVYTGSSMGPGDPITVMQRRDARHVVKNFAEGYYAAVLNAYVTTIGANSQYGGAAMWGREQQVMDYHGGPVSDRGGYQELGEGGRNRASNKIRTWGKNTVGSKSIWLTANLAFGELWRYTGIPMFEGVIVPDKPVYQNATNPFFYPF